MPNKKLSVRDLNEERRAVRRVLVMVNNFVKQQDADTLTTDGKGLMTWGELREHIELAMNTTYLRMAVK